MQHIAFIQNNNLLQYNALICNATQIYAHTYIYIYIQLRKTAQINNTYCLKYTKQQPQYTTTTVHHSVKEYNINHKIQNKEPPTPQQETQFNTKHRTSRYITSPSLPHTCTQQNKTKHNKTYANTQIVNQFITQ